MDLVVSSGHLWVKVAGQGQWPEGLAYRSGRIFGCVFRLAYGSGQMQVFSSEIRWQAHGCSTPHDPASVGVVGHGE